MDVIENTGVSEVKDGWLHLKDDRKVEFDECLWCTEAAAAPWLRDTPGLPTGRCTFSASRDVLGHCQDLA